MPESPAHWVPLAAIPVLLAVGALAVLHWSRYLGAIGRLERAIHAAKAEATLATQGLAGEIERAKEERAFWILQKKFADNTPARSVRLQRRRQRSERTEADA